MKYTASLHVDTFSEICSFQAASAYGKWLATLRGDSKWSEGFLGSAVSGGSSSGLKDPFFVFCFFFLAETIENIENCEWRG